MTVTAYPPRPASRIEFRTGPSTLQNIIVATDGAVHSDPAVAFARSLADREAAHPVLVSVCEPSAPASDWGPMGVVPAPPTAVPDTVDERRLRAAAIKAQLKRVLGATVPWPITVVAGPVAESIAQFVRKHGGDLVVTGRGKHGFFERMLGEEHIVNVVRSSDVPVLAAAAPLRHAPRRAVVALGMHPDSLHIAQTAADLMAGGTGLYLVHVETDEAQNTAYPERWRHTYESAAREHLEQVRSMLRVPVAAAIECVVLSGRAAQAIGDFASKVRADVIAVGVDRHAYLNRRAVGRVTKSLLRSAPTSVLAVPASA